jgi:hypothetical protein
VATTTSFISLLSLSSSPSSVLAATDKSSTNSKVRIICKTNYRRDCHHVFSCR